MVHLVLDSYHFTSPCTIKNRNDVKVTDFQPLFGSNFVLLFVGLLTSDASTASQASNIIEELINNHMDKRNLSTFENPLVADDASCRMESSAIESTCAVFVNLLNARDGIPNEHILAVTSVLFLKLGMRTFDFLPRLITRNESLHTTVNHFSCPL